MNDEYLYGVLIYLVLASTLFGLLPDEVYSGSTFDNSDRVDDLREGLIQDDDIDYGDQIGFFEKMLTFMFMTFTIDGVPVLVGVLIFLINMISLSVPIVWFYDKVRGI